MSNRPPTIVERNRARDFAAEANWIGVLVERQRNPDTRNSETAALIQQWEHDPFVQEWRTQQLLGACTIIDPIGAAIRKGDVTSDVRVAHHMMAHGPNCRCMMTLSASDLGPVDS